ncbi:MAG: hypothetical protein AB1772_08060, partial [Candidatus Zixiibacteriota bacterium]
MKRSTGLILALGLAATWLWVADASAVELQPSPIAWSLHRVKFAEGSPHVGGQSAGDNPSPCESGQTTTGEPSDMKSPFKAFILSAVLPGAGQYYMGSRIKPILFLGAEAAAWGFH